jgi:mannosidase alpha-like ER degradation enhancer 2
MKSLHNMHSVWKQYGFLPEFYNIPNSEAGNNRDSYPLRPELIESVMYLYRATGDPYLLEVGEDILRSIQYSAKTPCGYATIKNVKDHRKQDSMESFFLAETTKYLYLLFDPDNFLNSDGGYGTLWDTPNGECIIESSYIYNTEAHPIDLGALRCCYDVPRESLVKGFNRQKFLGETVELNDRNIPELSEIKIEEESEDEEDPIKDTREFKKELLDEIMNALSNAKKKIEENVELKKRFIEITKREKDAGGFDSERNVVDLGKMPKKPADQDDNEDEMVAEEIENSIKKVTEPENPKKPPIEIVKLKSPSALETDPVSTQPSKANDNNDDDDDDSTGNNNNLTGPSTNEKARDMKTFSKPTNNSILTDFVQAILKSSSSQKPFNEQQLLQRIRSEGAKAYPKNESWSSRYDLLTCKAQPYLQRISVMGEFY